MRILTVSDSVESSQGVRHHAHSVHGKSLRQRIRGLERDVHVLERHCQVERVLKEYEHGRNIVARFNAHLDVIGSECSLFLWLGGVLSLIGEQVGHEFLGRRLVFLIGYFVPAIRSWHGIRTDAGGTKSCTLGSAALLVVHDPSDRLVGPTKLFQGERKTSTVLAL